MSDRLNALTVSLDRDIRDDDAEVIINAIKAIRGVNGVTGNIVDMDTFSAQMRVNSFIREKLFALIDELNKI